MPLEILIPLVFWALVAWGVWRIFRRRIMAHPASRALMSRWRANRVPEEAYYARAAEEIRNGQLRQGLWAKAWAEAKGETAKVEARYIQLRVEALRREVAGRLFDASGEELGGTTSPTGSVEPDRTPEGAVVDCPRCSARLRVALRKVLNVSCPKCGARFRAET